MFTNFQSISPGVVHTDGWEQLGLEKNYGPVPFLKPEDVADTVEFALSTPPHVQVNIICTIGFFLTIIFFRSLS